MTRSRGHRVAIVLGVAVIFTALDAAEKPSAAGSTLVCDVTGSWHATYAWDGGESSGMLIVTIDGDGFVGKTAGDHGAETLRGTIDDGAIAGVAVLHSRRGWVPAMPDTSDDCGVITLTLPDAEVTLTR